MSQVYIGTIQLFGFNFAPKNWALCNGQLMAINTNQALFSLLGTAYGGNGQTTFALPDLRGRTALGTGQNLGQTYVTGSLGGEQAHTLLTNEMPTHTHQLNTDSTTAAANNLNAPANNVLGQTAGSASQAYGVTLYTNTATPNNIMAPQVIATTGQSRAHENRMPFLVMSYCICLAGFFPPRS